MTSIKARSVKVGSILIQLVQKHEYFNNLYSVRDFHLAQGLAVYTQSCDIPNK